MTDLNEITDRKNRIREMIRDQKKEFSNEWKLIHSETLLSLLETTELFQNAQCILIYYSLPDEVHTHDFLKKWYQKKTILLPFVDGDRLFVREYDPQNMKKGKFGINEPMGVNIEDYDKIDLAVIPGVSFDLKGNRLGRGKGYYDGLLPLIKAPKIGVAFSWQLFEEIPTNENDWPMNGILTETDFYLNL